MWNPDEERRDVAARKLAYLRACAHAQAEQLRAAGDNAPQSTLVGDVNYAHLPYCADYLRLDRTARVVVLRREREATVRSFFDWTEPGGDPGTALSRNHWQTLERDNAATTQLDEWDFTFPKVEGAASKREAIGKYYDEYYARAGELAREFPGRVAFFESPDLFHDRGQLAALLTFLGVDAPPPPANAPPIHANRNPPVAN